MSFDAADVDAKHREFDYVRHTYGVPAFWGSAVLYLGDGRLERGHVINAKHGRLRVRFSNGIAGYLHPTWRLYYPGRHD